MHRDGPLSARPRVVRAPGVVGSIGIPVDLDEAARMSRHLTSGGHHRAGSRARCPDRDAPRDHRAGSREGQPAVATDAIRIGGPAPSPRAPKPPPAKVTSNVTPTPTRPPRQSGRQQLPSTNRSSATSVELRGRAARLIREGGSAARRHATRDVRVRCSSRSRTGWSSHGQQHRVRRPPGPPHWTPPPLLAHLDRLTVGCGRHVALRWPWASSSASTA
jgi:hypothetical protein